METLPAFYLGTCFSCLHDWTVHTLVYHQQNNCNRVCAEAQRINPFKSIFAGLCNSTNWFLTKASFCLLQFTSVVLVLCLPGLIVLLIAELSCYCSSSFDALCMPHVWAAYSSIYAETHRYGRGGPNTKAKRLFSWRMKMHIGVCTFLKGSSLSWLIWSVSAPLNVTLKQSCQTEWTSGQRLHNVISTFKHSPREGLTRRTRFAVKWGGHA